MDTTTTGTAAFARFVPYADAREVIVRRGAALGSTRYGFAGGRRVLRIDGAPIPLVTYRQLLSPPPLEPGQTPMSPAAAAHYTPSSEVAFLPGLELLLRRHPDGFTDDEVLEIVSAFFRQAQRALTPDEEARFSIVHASCVAGEVPALRVGDIVYVETELYVSHGADDFIGGLAEVTGLRDDAGPRPCAWIEIAQSPGSWLNWSVLATKQAQLAAEHGRSWSHARPDLRSEFNRP